MVDFEAWLGNQFATSGPFTALIILVGIDGTTVWPLGSSYATVIGNELTWVEMRRLFDRSKLAWTGAAIFPALSSANGPLPDEQAKQRLRDLEARVIADHLVINQGFFFDRQGRLLKLEPVGA